MINRLLIICIGIFGGLWISWPGIIKNESWECSKQIIIKSKTKGTPLRVVMALSPKHFLRRKSYRGAFGKIRILGDTCFREIIIKTISLLISENNSGLNKDV